MIRIYIAAPFFNDYQVEQVELIEQMLERHNIDFFSPRKHGVLMSMSNSEKLLAKKEMFQLNVHEITKCDRILAIIDGFDTGTIWEMGFAFGINTPVISISNQGHGLNVMLAESVQAHVKNLDDAIKAILNQNFKGEIITNVY